MPTSRSVLALVAAALGLGATAAVAGAAPSAVQTAPGRVVFATDGGVVRDSVDGTGGGFPVALPDGGVLIVGSPGGAGQPLAITRLSGAGAVVPGFGTGGTATVAVRLYVQQVVRQPDGALLLVGTRSLGGVSGPPPLAVVRVRPDGSLDTGFGSGGVATTKIGIGCGACTTAAVAPDGSIVLTGTTGTFPTNPTPTTVPDIHWSFTRLTPAGAVDTSFGTGGVATVSGVKASGFNVAVLPGGQIVGEAQTSAASASAATSILLTRLTPSGAPDASFGGGTPVTTPLSYGFPLLVRDDGSLLVAGARSTSATTTPFSIGDRLVAAYAADGQPDTSFATNGVANLGTSVDVQQLLPQADGGTTVVATPAQTLMPGLVTPAATFAVGHWGRSGPTDPAFSTVQLPFGGGGSSFVVSLRPRPLPPLGQNSFSGRSLVQRPDGSFLAVGGLIVSQPLGEGVGRSISRTAVAALTPGLALDPAFGGPATALRARIAFLPQRSRTARSRHGIRVRLQASAPGLWRVKIRAADGPVLAQSVLPVFGTGTVTLPVELTATGNRRLRRHRPLRVTVAATARDLLAQQATARAAGTLH